MLLEVLAIKKFEYFLLREPHLSKFLVKTKDPKDTLKNMYN